MAEPNTCEARIRRGTTPALDGLDDFYQKCDNSTWASAAGTVIEDCLDRGLSELHTSTQTVSLYCPIPGQGGRGPNVLQLNTSGDLTVCRGRIVDTERSQTLKSSALTPAGASASGRPQSIRHVFPNAN